MKTGGAEDAIEPVARIYDPRQKVEVVVYNMERFAKDCVTVFCELSGYASAKGGTAPTPFLDESNDPLAVIEEPTTNGQDAPKRPSVSAAGWVLPGHWSGQW